MSINEDIVESRAVADMIALAVAKEAKRIQPLLTRIVENQNSHEERLRGLEELAKIAQEMGFYDTDRIKSKEPT